MKTIEEFFVRFKCSKSEIYLLLNRLQAIRIENVIKNINEIKQKYEDL
ncbi:MAG: hypothetical protein LBR10_14455 [Prevotellaceae bacterium]|jgi:hypothetical protein|nr:hypothetical protein [Prevotellaceae bacterium]